MPLRSQDAVLLDGFTGTGTSGSGHNGWSRVEGSVHTVVVTTDGGSPTGNVEWSLDRVTVASTDALSFSSNVATVNVTGEVYRYARINVTGNAGGNELNALAVSI
ncbi:MAG: hypothetical protein KDK91_20345 [Gammaproteobacteria bacterium]|nr:hypothetical protein [Gammaproteobacteria bacterium]